MVRSWVTWFLLAVACASVPAQPATNSPAFAVAAEDTRKLQLLPGLKLDLWAAEPLLSNGVAFSLDGRGRVFVAESDRWSVSVFDITAHTNWLWQDMSFHTVADRAAFLRHEFATNLALLTRDSEVVRLIEDRDGDGRADHTEIIADGFNSVTDGTAAGILAREDKVWFANIPNLWLLSADAGQQASRPESKKGETSDSPAFPPAGLPTRYSLATGFGVHIGVSGHDLHGLIKGPDGRIYMSFGDRGVCLTNREGGGINLPDTGGVLRCEPDGRNLEVFCYGLRNPQELAFDDYGNLWTVDNDTAGADPCRVLHLVEGGDYGWRTSYQHMEGFGPWVQEELWKGGQDGILPPAGTVSQGPSGLAFYPGTGFGDRLADTFLHCDFPGGVVAFTVKPQGASYVVDHKEKFLWNCWPTDVDFGPDGAVYVLDWVSGWTRSAKGRIYRITDPSLAAAAAAVSSGPAGNPLEDSAADSRQRRREAELVAEVKRLLGERMKHRDEKELSKLLGHPDRRVRLEAQWELAARGPRSFAALREVAFTGDRTLPRLHALWGLEQIARAIGIGQEGGDLSDELATLIPLLDDADREICGQAAVVLASSALLNADLAIEALAADEDSRLRWHAAMAIGTQMCDSHRGSRSRRQKLAGWLEDHAPKIGRAVSQHVNTDFVFHIGVDEMVALVKANDGGDPWVEHACVRYFTRLEHEEAAWPHYRGISGGLRLRAASPDANLRRTTLLTLRRLTNSYITNFLTDPDPRLVEEAGRAIHDVPVFEGIPALAAFITKIDCPTNLYSRVIDACFRLGTQQHAQMLAGFAAREDVPDAARVLALRALGDWGRPGPLDRVNGLWRPLVVRESAAESGSKTAGESTTDSRTQLHTPTPLPAFARNLGRASVLPVLPSDLGRSASYEEGLAVTRNDTPARRAFLRVAGDLLNPSNLTEAGVPAGTREVLPLQIAVAETAAKLRTKEAGTPLYEKFANSNTAAGLRRAILPALAAVNAAQTSDAVRLALADPDPQLQAVAVPLLDRLEGEDVVGLLAGLVAAPSGRKESPANTSESGAKPANPPTPRRDDTLSQAALAALAKIPGVAADQALGPPLDALLSGTLPPALQLDVLSAARVRAGHSPAIAERLARFRASEPANDPLAKWRFALEGGDAARGRQSFLNNVTVQCLRCHKIGNDGGTVGPSLAGVGGRYSREYLLESIVSPNARIAAGFETAVVRLKDGRSFAGIVKGEGADAVELEITDPESGTVRTEMLRPSEIARRERGPSAMPEGLAELLTPFELRDLVEFLAELR